MKKHIGKIIVGISIISILIVIVVILLINKNNNNYSRPDYDYSAIIYHSEMMGIDAGTEYTYYIYKSSKSDNEYFYIKAKSTITIAGSGEESEVGSDTLNTKNDIEKIKKDIERDSKSDSETYTSYMYVNNGKSEKVDTLSELGNRLFK